MSDIVAAHPNDADAWSALGSLQRSAKAYEDAAKSYDKAIALVAAPDRSNWTLFYFRGICFERAKQWPKAEADFKKALELYPDQPQVLNYLGYSWVDQGINLDEAFKMLRRAVELGLTTAISSTASAGPTTSSAITSRRPRSWRRRSTSSLPIPWSTIISATPIGGSTARIEAHFQWNHARDMKPEPEDLPKILKKIEFGLPDEPSATPPAPSPAPAPSARAERRRLSLPVTPRSSGARRPRSI